MKSVDSRSLRPGDKIYCDDLTEMYTIKLALEKEEVEGKCMGANGEYWLEITENKRWSRNNGKTNM